MLLVTGITGHSGKYFLSHLIENNYDERIRVIVRNRDEVTDLEESGLNIEVLVGDLDDQTFLDDALSGANTLFHIASIFYSANIVKAAINHHVQRIILVHTTGIYSKFKSASFEYKTIETRVNSMIEDADYKIDLTILRPTMIFGYANDRNMIKFIKLVDKLPIVPVVDGGRGLLQPVHGRDLGKAYYQVLVSVNLASDYILSGERALSMFELFKMISQYLGKQKTIISVPKQVAVLSAQVLRIISLNRVDFVERVQRMSEDRNFSHELATKDFQYSPSSFDDNLSEEVQLYINLVGKKL